MISAAGKCLPDIYPICFNEIPALKEELNKLKLKPIHTNTAQSVAVVSTEPFTKFEDFKGKRIRAASRWWLGQLKGAGAIPVSIPWGDCYMALQTGTIEGVYTNREFWVGMPFIYAINVDKWNKLPKAIQTQIMAVGESAAIRFQELHETEWAKTEAAQKEMGCTITAASPTDIKKWVTMPAIKELQKKWLEEAKEAGITDADEILAKMKALLAEAIERDKQ